MRTFLGVQEVFMVTKTLNIREQRLHNKICFFISRKRSLTMQLNEKLSTTFVPSWIQHGWQKIKVMVRMRPRYVRPRHVRPRI